MSQAVKYQKAVRIDILIPLENNDFFLDKCIHSYHMYSLSTYKLCAKFDLRLTENNLLID